jgi:hypothetical protein
VAARFGLNDEMDRLIARLKRGDAVARIGVLDDEEAALHLWWAEFGTLHAPPRPTLTAAYDEAEGALARAMEKGLRRLVFGQASAADGALRPVAEDLLELVVDRVDGNTPPELAPSTIAARRRRDNYSTRTLVDTRHMLESIALDVRLAPFGAEPTPINPAAAMSPTVGRIRRGPR